MQETTLQEIRTVAFIASLSLVLGLEVVQPWKHWARARHAGRARNVMLAAVNAIAVGVVCGACVLEAATWSKANGAGLFAHVQVPAWSAAIVTVLAFDLLAWVWHRANHVVPLLWRFHAVHHSDPVFDATTAFRFHTVEILASLPLRVGVAVALSAPAAGIVAFEVLFGFCNLFVHGNIRLPAVVERFASGIFVLPALHRLHHSADVVEQNRNFGTIFSFWDRIAGSFLDSRSDRNVIVGLQDFSGARPTIALLAAAFRRRT